MPEQYRIKIRDQLDPKWIAWFEGMRVSTELNGETVLWGPVEDQAALHGLLAKVRDLGLTLVSMECLPDPAASPLDSDSMQDTSVLDAPGMDEPFDWLDDDDEVSEGT